MTDQAKTPAAAPAPSGVLAWIRSLDIRKVATAIVVLGALEHGIVVGEVPLADAVPASWIPHIVAWCKIFVWLNPFLLASHSFTALKWPQPKAPGGFNAVALILFAIVGASLLWSPPAFAASRKPLPQARPTLSLPSLPCIGVTNLPLGCTPNTAAVAAPGAANAVDPLTFLRQFSYADVQNALNDANGQTPPNKTSAQCWAFLLTLIPPPAAPASAAPGSAPAQTANPATALLPTTPGIASAIQKALDDQQLLLTWFSPNGGLAQLNLACAPLVNLLNVQLATGGGLTAAAAAALTNPATAPIVAGVQALLTGAIAIIPK